MNVSITPNVTATFVSSLSPKPYRSFHNRFQTDAIIQNETLTNERRDQRKVKCVKLLPVYNYRNGEQAALGNTDDERNTRVKEEEITMRRTLRSSNSLRNTLSIKQNRSKIRSFLLD